MISFLFRRARWADLSMRTKTWLVFVIQLLLIGLLAVPSWLSVRNAGQQREALRSAQQVQALAADISAQLATARAAQVEFERDWGVLGFDVAEQLNEPVHDSAIDAVQADISLLEGLLEDTNPASSEDMAGNARSISASATAYEQHFDAMLDFAENLGGIDSGALAALETAALDLERNAASTRESRIIAGVLFNLRPQERAYLSEGDAANLATLREHARVVDEQLATIDDITARLTRESLNVYLAQLAVVEPLVSGVRVESNELGVLATDVESISVELLATSNQDAADALASAEQAAIFSSLVLGVSVLALVVSGGVAILSLGGQVGRRLGGLADSVRRVAQGDLTVRAGMAGDDEVGQLAGAFNAMADQMQAALGGLEAEADSSARHLKTISEIGQAIASVRDMDKLLEQAVEVLRDRFGFYHVQIFLVDELGHNIVLSRSTGTVGRRLLTRGHSIPVGSETIIGQVTGLGRPLVMHPEDGDSTTRDPDELRPETRSEMALPLKIGNDIIGVLDIQSDEDDAFGEADVAVFQIMADQLVVAIRNAQLFTEAQTALADVRELNRSLTGETWSRYLARRAGNSTRIFRIKDEVVESDAGGLPPELLEKLRDQPLVWLDGEDDIEVAIPIRVRGEVIGAFGFGGGDVRNLDEDAIGLIQTVAERVSIALENARLFEQTQQQASREQTVNEITRMISGSTEVSDILETTARELGKVLRSPRTKVRLLGEQDNE